MNANCEINFLCIALAMLSLFSPQREDWDDICDIPVGIVPGGSGNALSCSLLRPLGQPLDGINNLGATWAGTNVAVGAAGDKSLPLDLLEVELANDAGQKHISFLGVTIGLIADCDIGNVNCRNSE